MTNEQIIEVGKALLPYLRNDLDPADLGRAAHDAAAALRRGGSGLSDQQRCAIACGNEPYADDKVCPTCGGCGHVSGIAPDPLRKALQIIAGFGDVNLASEWESSLRDIIRSMTDCAKRALNLGRSDRPALEEEDVG